jgi:hypothetical protein
MNILYCVCVGEPLDYTVQWKISYKYHKYMDILYVFADVSSDNAAAWMTYYTHDKYDVLQYVWVDVHSDHPALSMIFYKHKRHMHIFHYMCTGITSDYPDT